MFDARETTQTVWSSEESGAAYCELCIHDAFDRQAAQTPDAFAVVDGEQQVSYLELQRRAQRLALTLREAGVGPDAPVALLAERSIDAVIGLLAVLKAGGAYVPINPHDPEERITAIVDHAGAALTLVQPHLRHRLRTPGTGLIELNEGAIADNRCAGRTATNTGPSNLAAIVYTSGSTGVPKGVEIPHRSFMARVRNGYRPRRHDLQKAPLSVVAHFSDLLLPLISGGPVIFLADECLNSGRALLEVIVHYGTSRMVFVPSQLSALLEGGTEAITALGRLDSVIVSGESLSPALVKNFRRLLPRVGLMNAYGASEVSGLACMGEVSSPDDITVGTAIAGCTAYVLDDDRQLVPPGGVGEVYLGGAQLARGYRRDLSLTMQRFVPDPFSQDGRYMYQTGDLAERLPDGRIRIVGRRDFEVKVHGFRVNPNEVEAVLERLPGVQRAVVVSNGVEGQRRLSAFVLVQPSSFDPADSTSLRAALAAQLPSYMVPSRIRLMSTFPLLPNGKVDRLSLAAWDSNALTVGETVRDGYIAPRTVTERALADIWQHLLGVSRIGATDNFFALGGDSLDATRFILRAEELGVIVTPEQLEDASSLETLALAIDTSGAIELDPDIGASCDTD